MVLLKLSLRGKLKFNPAMVGHEGADTYDAGENYAMYAMLSYTHGQIQKSRR